MPVLKLEDRNIAVPLAGEQEYECFCDWYPLPVISCVTVGDSGGHVQLPEEMFGLGILSPHTYIHSCGRPVPSVVVAFSTRSAASASGLMPLLPALVICVCVKYWWLQQAARWLCCVGVVRASVTHLDCYCFFFARELEYL